MSHGFIELHAHTEYSNVRLIDCLSKLKAVVNHAVKIGLQGVAITDHECLSGHVKALKLIKEIHETNPEFRLILGNEIYLCHNAPVSFDEKGNQKYCIESKDFFHFILLAKDAVGHSQLRLLSSRAWSRVYSYKHMERVPTFYSDIEEIVGSNPGHLIASTACLGGEFAKLALAGDAEGSAEFVQWCQRQFGKDNFFIELQPGLSEEQVQFNQRAIKFCKFFDVPWIITNDVHYLTKEKQDLHAIYLNSHDEERETGDFYESTYFKTPVEMCERMQYLEPMDIAKGFENTIKIGEMCKFAGDYGLFHTTIVPQRELPVFHPNGSLDSEPEKYPFIHKMYTSAEPQDHWLVFQLEQGMERKHQAYNDENLSRINVELEQIYQISQKLQQPVSAYYNLTQQIVEIMWEKGESFVGCGRGSVGGWYIAYLMDIMQLNPIAHGTHWWRHLHGDRPEMPDVDLDTAAYKRPQVFQATKDVFGNDHCLNIITFRTESTKAAVATACRGLGIDNDTAKELSALVPMTRGRVWSVKEMLHGNEDNGFVPIHAFVKKVAEYPMLLETISEIEGLICGRGSHASAEIIYNQPYYVHNSLMKSPKGIETTCWDMGDSEACSALKEDYLTIEALDKMMVCMNFLLKDGLIEWQGSLKATYDKYLHPDVIDYTSPEMWREMADGEIPDLFQMQTDVGGDAIKRIRPTSMKELSLTNAVMRLSANEDMSPIDRFIAFKNDVSLWYKEMADAGLNTDEVTVLEKYLKPNYGCSIEQEDIMLIVMDEKISGFDMKWANKLRKGLAKKKKEIIDEVTAEYYRKGAELGTRKEMLDYVFKYCIKPQLGYSFSANHDLPYSCIAVQEANLYHHYPHIYWQCAVLTVNASANEENEDNKSTNYGKTASAVSSMQAQGVKIVLPDINKAEFGFSPDAQNNQIIFGLKAISGVGDDDAMQIISNRPYTSMKDFVDKNHFGRSTMVALIKAGCFDVLEGIDRSQIMHDYLIYQASLDNAPKTKLTMANFQSLVSLNLIPDDRFGFEKKLALFRSYVFSKEFMLEKDAYRCDVSAAIFFENHLFKVFKRDSDYEYRGDTLVLFKKPFEKFYKTAAAEMMAYVASPELVPLYNDAVVYNDAYETWCKYCNGTISRWEMEALSFYYTSHELTKVSASKYGLSDFSTIPAEPVVVGSSTRKVKDKITGETKNSVWDKYQLYRIAGTVLDKNKNKHSLTLLTTDGVVTVKFYAEAFAHYDKQISKVDPSTGKKTVLEKSWFARGNKLLITGIRRGDTFFPKKYFDSIYQHTVCLITSVTESGDIDMILERQRT